MLHLVTFNLENLFDLITEEGERRGRWIPTYYELETKLRKLARAVAGPLSLPDIIVAQEIDNEEILQELGDRLNAANHLDYRACSFPTSDRRSIEVGFLYDRHRVTLIDSYQLSGLPVERAFGSFSPSPGREPIVGRFGAGELTFDLIGVHLKSKAGVSPLDRHRRRKEQLQEAQRVEQARVLKRIALEMREKEPEVPIIIAGDFNDFAYLTGTCEEEQAISIVSGRDGELPLTDILERIPLQGRYTYIHTGTAQLLDHIFLTPDLLSRVAGVEVHHINAGQPRELAEDESRPERCSDHDPVSLYLRL